MTALSNQLREAGSVIGAVDAVTNVKALAIDLLGGLAAISKRSRRMNAKSNEVTAKLLKAIPRIGTGIITILTAGSASADTDWLDVDIFMAARLAPVMAVSAKGGRWERAPVRMLVGLERISNAPKCRANDRENCGILDSYQMVVDMTAAVRNVPNGCGKKLAAPWKRLRETFPPKEGFSRSLWSPTRQERRDGWPFQELIWTQGDCQITARFAFPVVSSRVFASSDIPLSMRGLNRGWFKGGNFQEISLTLASNNERATYLLAIPFEFIRSERSE